MTATMKKEVIALGGCIVYDTDIFAVASKIEQGRKTYDDLFKRAYNSSFAKTYTCAQSLFTRFGKKTELTQFMENQDDVQGFKCVFDKIQYPKMKAIFKLFQFENNVLILPLVNSALVQDFCDLLGFVKYDYDFRNGKHHERESIWNTAFYSCTTSFSLDVSWMFASEKEYPIPNDFT